MQPIGRGYSPTEVEATAKARREEDRKHKLVYWYCEHCKIAEVEPTDFKRTANQCKCGQWMVWSYRPFACNAA